MVIAFIFNQWHNTEHAHTHTHTLNSLFNTLGTIALFETHLGLRFTWRRPSNAGGEAEATSVIIVVVLVVAVVVVVVVVHAILL